MSSNLKFKGHLFDAEGLPEGLTFTMKQKLAHSLYNNEQGNVPNRMSASLIKALTLWESGKVAWTSDKTFVEFDTESDGTICVIGERPDNKRIFFKCGYIDENDVIREYTRNTDGTYTVSERAGLMAALLPFALEDPEAQELLNKIRPYIRHFEDKNLLSKFYSASEMDELSKSLIILTDNIYRRTEKLPSFNAASLVMSASQVRKLRITDLKTMGIPQSSRPYSFKHFSFSNAQNKDLLFEGRYTYQERTWTDDERLLIPKLREDYVMPQHIVQICRRMKATTKFPAPMRTVLLSGPAGSGKTEGSRAIFAGLGLPCLFQTCGEGTEFLDLIGQVMPAGQTSPVSFEEIRTALGLPSAEDILFDPDAAYQKLYGKEASGLIDEGDLIHEMCQRTMDEVKKIGASGKDFIYIESPFIRAVKNGYGFELQEVDMLKRPSIIVGLNALLESGHNSIITLPTGEIIKKHPDCTIVFTDNGNYEGARKLNQAVLSRMSMVYLLDDPSADEMRNRAMKRLNFPNEVLLSRMVKVIKAIKTYTRSEDITDGVCGQRELENWAMSVMVDAELEGLNGKDIPDEMVHDCAIETVINKASQDPDDVARIQTACLDKEFVG